VNAVLPVAEAPVEALIGPDVVARNLVADVFFVVEVDLDTILLVRPDHVFRDDVVVAAIKVIRGSEINTHKNAFVVIGEVVSVPVRTDVVTHHLIVIPDELNAISGIARHCVVLDVSLIVRDEHARQLATSTVVGADGIAGHLVGGSILTLDQKHAVSPVAGHHAAGNLRPAGQKANAVPVVVGGLGALDRHVGNRDQA